MEEAMEGKDLQELLPLVCFVLCSLQQPQHCSAYCQQRGQSPQKENLR